VTNLLCRTRLGLRLRPQFDALVVAATQPLGKAQIEAVKPLDRQELDVVNQTRSNLFGWRGQFTPEFVA
jgi:hypothetical protein